MQVQKVHSFQVQVWFIILLSSKAQFSLKINIQFKAICLNGLTPYRKVSNTMSKILTIYPSVSANDIYSLNRSVLQPTTYPVPSTIRVPSTKTPVITSKCRYPHRLHPTWFTTTRLYSRVNKTITNQPTSPNQILNTVTPLPIFGKT